MSAALVIKFQGGTFKGMGFQVFAFHLFIAYGALKSDKAIILKVNFMLILNKVNLYSIIVENVIKEFKNTDLFG